MSVLQAIILSIVEGFTEFLPISSTGHLILVSKLLSIPQTEFVKSFEIIIQFGAILAIIFLYWKTLLQKKEVWLRIIAAFIPTGIFGFILYKFVKQFLIGNEVITVIALFLGGLFLIVIDYIKREDKHDIQSIDKIPVKSAFLIGLCQSLAMIPGVSRAAATILSARILRVNKEASVTFSFLLAIPTMAAATGYDLIKSNTSFTGTEYALLAIGFVGSFIVAVFSVKFFLSYIKRNSFLVFGIYRIIVAILYWFFIIR